MKLFTNLVKSTWYSLLMNTIIILSVLFILIESFVNISALTYKILLNIEIVILLIFLLDFICRFLAGGIPYFLKDFGWIDLLAVFPLLNPAIKAFSFLRVFRSLRFLRILRTLRIFRILKLQRGSSDPDSKLKQQFFLTVSSVILLILIIAGGLFIANLEYMLDVHNKQNETTLIGMTEQYQGSEDKINFLKSQPEVLNIMTISEIKPENDVINRLFRLQDFRTARVGSFYVVFSREKSRHLINMMEGLLILCIFALALITSLMLSKLFDNLVLNKIKPLNNKLRERLKLPVNPEQGTLEELENLVNQLVKK